MDAHERQCKICHHGPEKIDWSLTNDEIGELVDCSEGSVRRHKAWVERTNRRLESPSEEVPGTWVPKSKWTGGESYTFVPDTTAPKVDHEALDAALAHLDSLVPARVPETDRTDYLSLEPQIGKAGDHGGGTPETLERINKAMQRAHDIWGREGYPGEVFLVDIGDIIENIFNSKSQKATNDLTLPEQVETAINLYVRLLGQLVVNIPIVHHVAVTSNHGEARTDYKENPYDAENDWGLMIQRMVQARCEDKGWDVKFHRPTWNEDTTVAVNMHGVTFAFNHGHHSGNQNNMKKWLHGQIVGRRPGWAADFWMFGHYHSDYYFRFGAGQVAFGAPAIDPGSLWYARSTGESCPPGILLVQTVGKDWRMRVLSGL